MKAIQNKKEKKIIVLIFFFGKLPWYVNYFLHSCAYNPDIDFLIIHDKDSVADLPENVFLLRKSIEEVKELVCRKLECDITLDPQPYKFCDFRPSFGVIFQEYIENYAFWGHGDLDVIFGNIRNFITDELLDTHDVISLRHDYISSWFTLYRNTRNMNQLYKKSADYRKVFTTSTYYNFDETNFTFKEFADGLPYHRIGSEIESMTHLIKKLQIKNKIRAYFDLHAIEGLTGHIEWNHGQMFYKDKYEIMLYHLLELKKIYHPEIIPERIPNIFHIGQDKIHF